MGASIRIRVARPEEAPALSDLALRSKAHWGYDDVFLDACRDELTVTRDHIERDVVAVLEIDGVTRGLYVLRAEIDGKRPSCHRAELDLSYLDPASIGEGNGRRLWSHVVVSAREHGYRQIILHSDPHAEGFYQAMGARRLQQSLQAPLSPPSRYLFGTGPGAALYNLAHHQGVAVAACLVGAWSGAEPLLLAGTVLLGHSAFDRILGYGLKYPDTFRHTHLDEIP